MCSYTGIIEKNQLLAQEVKSADLPVGLQTSLIFMDITVCVTLITENVTKSVVLDTFFNQRNAKQNDKYECMCTMHAKVRTIGTYCL